MSGWIGTLGLGIGSAWLSGINLYATVATLGLAQHFGYAHLPGDLDRLGDWWVIAVAAALFAIEFVADKVPAIDSAWDAVHTFIRVPAGAILAISAFANFPPSVRIIAMLAGGAVAMTSHGSKAAARLAANTSPEPFSNVLLSLLEDLFTIGMSILLVLRPVVVLIIALIFVVLALWMARKVWRALLRLFRRGPAGQPPVPSLPQRQ
jgi:hypothetical protein